MENEKPVVAPSGSGVKNRRVPKTLDDRLRDLSAQYHAAYSAHRGLAMAIAEIAMGGERPPDLMQDSEKEAARELAKVTHDLRAAMAELAELAQTKANPGSQAASDAPRAASVVVPLKRGATRR